MSKPTYQGNLEGYQKYGDACSLHHTDPAIPVHRSVRSHKSHPHWHLWSTIWVGSIFVFDACSLHLTHWQLNSHLNLLLQGVLVRKVLSLPSTSWSQSSLCWASAQPTHTSPRCLLFSSSILAFWDGWDSAYQLL